MPNNQTLLYAITLEFTLPLGTPPSRDAVEHEVQLFLDEMETNPPQVTWEMLDTAPNGWPEVRFVGSLRDINNVICQWNGGDGQGIQETLEHIETLEHVEPVLDYAIVEGQDIESGEPYQCILLPVGEWSEWTCEMSDDEHPAEFEALDWPTWSVGGPYTCKACILEMLASGAERIVRTLSKSEFDNYCNGKEI